MPGYVLDCIYQSAIHDIHLVYSTTLPPVLAIGTWHWLNFVSLVISYVCLGLVVSTLCLKNKSGTFFETQCRCYLSRTIAKLCERFHSNKNIIIAIRSWSASCSTFASYHTCCQHNGRRVLTTDDDGRTLLTTHLV